MEVKEEKMGFLKALFSGKIETAEEQAKEKEARNFDVLKYDGVRAMRAGQLDYAKECFLHALEYQDDLEVRESLADVLIHQGNLENGMEQLQVLIAAEADNVELLLKAAHVEYMQDHYDEMMELCQKALVLNPEQVEALYLQARAYEGLGNLVTAVAVLTQAIALNENYGNAYLLRAMLLLKMGDAAAAAQDLDYLLEQVPENEDVLLEKARVEKALGHTDDSLSYYNKVVETNPFRVEAFRERGALRLELGDKSGATEDMRTVLELDPEAAQVSGEFH